LYTTDSLLHAEASHLTVAMSYNVLGSCEGLGTGDWQMTVAEMLDNGRE
jgi:hypothetical protein